MVSSTESELGDDETREVKPERRALTEVEAHDLDRTRLSDSTAKVLVDADRRDADATARDAVADERERVADRQSFMDPGATYAGHRARRDAALDRRDAKSDRESSAEDRARLTQADDGNGADGEG